MAALDSYDITSPGFSLAYPYWQKGERRYLVVPKFYLITGASSGIGAATAIRLAGPNTIIGIHYNRSVDGARRTADAVHSKEGTAILLPGDLTQENDCRALMEQVARHAEVLDVLVNNAGAVIRQCRVTEFEWELMEQTFRLNVFSTLLLSSLAIPFLSRSGNSPCIVNISSIVARNGAPGATIYGASKGSIDAFTRGLAKELAPTIRVNAVAPGIIETPLHQRLSTEQQMLSWKNATPLGRNGTADDVAQAVVFLVEHTFITGETIDVNGGYFMR